MKNIIASIVLSAGLVWGHAALAGDEQPAPLDFGPRQSLTIVSGDQKHEFSVEIADTQEERNRGLMFRDVIAPTEGMLFEFDSLSVSSIWMKNTAVFLDVIFVNEKGRIVKIEHSALPYKLRSINSELPVTAVLEIAGGRARALEIKPGDLIEHRFFDTGE